MAWNFAFFLWRTNRGRGHTDIYSPVSVVLHIRLQNIRVHDSHAHAWQRLVLLGTGTTAAKSPATAAVRFVWSTCDRVQSFERGRSGRGTWRGRAQRQLNVLPVLAGIVHDGAVVDQLTARLFLFVRVRTQSEVVAAGPADWTIHC